MEDTHARPQLQVVMAQTNPLVGDIPGNAALVVDTVRRAMDEHQGELVVFSELMLTAYPPEDLLLRPSLQPRVEKALRAICDERLPVHVAVGHPWRENGGLYNMLSVIHEGKVVATYRKQCLPNYQVFDEKRYFTPGGKPCIVTVKGLPVAFTICEDMWEAGPMRQAADAGAGLMVNINGSPFHRDKLAERHSVLRQRAGEGAMPIIYVNQVGGQDELVFDGGSMVVDPGGRIRVLAPRFEEALMPVTLSLRGRSVPEIERDETYARDEGVAGIYRALVLGVRDYVNKNGFPGVILGLSGGIDSALSLAVAVDALGPGRVRAVMMPYKYTSRVSLEESEREAENFGVHYRVIPIEAMYESFVDGLGAELDEGEGRALTEQNLQARCRGVILMALSNKSGWLVLTTGNKSEMAVGYATLYGDMAGGFDVLKDVPKMLVYELARYRNEAYGDCPREMIPGRIIDRPPSAELAPGQVDEDNLPPYSILDEILELYIEYDYSANAIIDKGFETDTVYRVLRLVDRNEYKRRQAPIGVRVTKRGFGRDRRYPVTSGWMPGE